jgi:hypothetical protein
MATLSAMNFIEGNMTLLGRFVCAGPLLSVALLSAMAAAAHADTLFSTGDLVLSLYGEGNITQGGDVSGTPISVGNAPYSDGSASPIILQQVSTGGTLEGSIALPQTTTTIGGTTNYAISGEFGSSSEGILELSGNGQYLTIAGYDVNADSFNTDPSSYGGATKSCIGTAAPCYPLAQTASVANYPSSSGNGYATVVPRTIAVIGSNGSVNTSTALTGVFNENNPRSVATINGSTLYISGEGVDGDTTEGLFVAQIGSKTATSINTAYDTRTAEIYNDQLFVSQDSKVGSGQLAFVASVGGQGNLPNGATTPTLLPGLVTGSKKSADPGEITLSGGNGNSINGSSGGIYLSPESFFFANATTLYVADSGSPKAGGAGDGGLQKWSLVNGVWDLDYTLSSGLDLVDNNITCTATQTAPCGTTGLIGLTGEDVDINGIEEVEFFATNATLSDEDETYLLGITDLLSATSAAAASGENFTVLDTAGADTVIRGVAFAPTAAPVPEPITLSIFGAGLVATLMIRRRKAKRA